MNDDASPVDRQARSVDQCTWSSVSLPVVPLRDWFAGMAMQGLLARTERGGGKLWYMGDEDPPYPGTIFVPKDVAERWSKACYDIANAMLAEREH